MIALPTPSSRTRHAGFSVSPQQRPAVLSAGLRTAGSRGRSYKADCPIRSPVPPPLAADPRVPDRLYLGTMDGAIYVSADRGAAWSVLATGLPAILRFALAAGSS